MVSWLQPLGRPSTVRVTFTNSGSSPPPVGFSAKPMTHMYLASVSLRLTGAGPRTIGSPILTSRSVLQVTASWLIWVLLPVFASPASAGFQPVGKNVPTMAMM